MCIKKALSFTLAATLLPGLCAGCGKSDSSVHDDAMQAKDGGDAAKTVELLTKATEKDSAQALIALGSIYAYGASAEQDSEKAAQWFEKAAVLGYEDAAEALERLDQPNP